MNIVLRKNSPPPKEVLADMKKLKGKSPAETEGIQRLYIKEMCRNDPYLFGKLFLTNWIYKDYGKIHGWLMQKLYSDDPCWAVAFPRKHGKTTIKKLFLTHAIAYGNFKYIILTGDTAVKVKKDLANIKHQMETNAFLKDVFGEFYNPDKWTADEIVTKNTAVHLLVMSRGQSFRGLLDDRAPDLILIDDLEDEESINTHYMRQKLEDWLNGNVVNSVDQEVGKVRMIGTVLHSESVLKNRENDPLWKTKYLPCIVDADTDEARPLWPEFYSLKKLMAKRESYFAGKDPKVHIWYHEWMNIAIAKEDRRLDDSKIRYRELTLEFEGETTLIVIDGNRQDRRVVNTFTAVDLAGSRSKQGDFWVVNTGALDSAGCVYLLNTIRQRNMGQQQCVNYMFDHAKLYKTKATFIELIGCMDMIMDTYDDTKKKRKTEINLEMKKSRKGSKDDRIMGAIAPKMNNELVFCKNGQTLLQDECREFMPGKESKNDVLDTVSDIIKFGWRPESLIRKEDQGLPFELTKPKADEVESSFELSAPVRSLGY